MKIQKILTEYRNDFTATIECEHCGCLESLKTGYHDNFYHTKVIPSMHCSKCGRNRAGEIALKTMGGAE